MKSLNKRIEQLLKRTHKNLGHKLDATFTVNEAEVTVLMDNDDISISITADSIKALKKIAKSQFNLPLHVDGICDINLETYCFEVSLSVVTLDDSFTLVLDIKGNHGS